MPVFFAKELEGVATFWRIFRADGIAHGLISHDRALTFDGITHQAAPGMLPSAIRKSSGLSLDSAEVEGALSHRSISEDDLALGLFDGADIAIGVIDWESLDRAVLYRGNLGKIDQSSGSFTAELRSAKAALDRDLVPRTSPTCRAEFCGPGCNLSRQSHIRMLATNAIDLDNNAVGFPDIDEALYLEGRVRFLEGPQLGREFAVIGTSDGMLVLDRPLDVRTDVGMKAELQAGCDHTLATCRTRFGNAVNFRGEPYLPGNDLLARYANPQG